MCITRYSGAAWAVGDCGRIVDTKDDLIPASLGVTWSEPDAMAGCTKCSVRFIVFHPCLMSFAILVERREDPLVCSVHELNQQIYFDYVPADEGGPAH